ncbi:MAG: Crp/Fnr family transcriptional regulator [Chloroflexi bacterium]|nr:Crp/Fnr family transcriptional regulator [Chloroflexota bacterium]
MPPAWRAREGHGVDELVALLGRVQHFRGLSESDLRGIIGRGRLRQVPAGGVLFEEGEPSAGLFVLLGGRVHLGKVGPAGQQVILTTLEPVIMFNEVAGLDRGTNPVTAVAADPSRVWQVDGDNLQAILLAYPRLGLGLLQVLARRNRSLLSHVEDLSFRSVAGRAARLLLDLSRDGEQPIDRRRHPNSEMAARIVTAPEALSRSLQAFRREGAISTTRATIHVREASRLRRWIEGAG